MSRMIDRRALFASGAAAALLAAAGASAADAPRRGGVLRLAVPREGGLMEQAALGALHDTLTTVAPDGLLRGELAQGWQSSADARAWRLDLVPGVQFHSGRAVTAADAAASLNAQGIAGADLRAARAEGAHVLHIALAAPNPHLPYLLADPALAVLPGGQAAGGLAAADGAGCYRVERACEGRHFRASRVAGHYRGDAAGWADAIEIIVIPDAAVRAEALRDGYVDVAALPEPKGLRRRAGLQYHPSANDMALAVRQGVGMPRVIGARAPLDDGRLAERWWLI